MPAYRLYCVDGAGKIISAEWLEADDESAAVDAARAASGDGRFELWRRQKMIVRIVDGKIIDQGAS